MKGKFIVITGPSAAGKTKLVDVLLQRIPNSARLVTTTTRAPRPGEKDGVDYFFISRREFEQGLRENDFYEHAEVYGNLYGSSRKALASFLERYAFVFAIIDVQGADTLKKLIPESIVVFIRPGSFGDIERRLHGGRMGVPKGEMQRRIAQARNELLRAGDFDFTVDNIEGEFEATVSNVLAILEAHGLAKEKRPVQG